MSIRIQKPIQNIRESLTEHLKQVRSLYVVCQTIATLGFPLLEAVLVNYLTTIVGTDREAIVTILIAVVTIHVFLAISLFAIQAPAPMFYAQLDSQANKIEDLMALKTQLLEQLELAIKVLGAIQFNYASLEEFLKDGSYSCEDTMNFIIEPWKMARCEIWGYTSRSIWNFVLYWVKDGDVDANVMEVKWRLNDDRLERLDREWTKGDGHVGRCWNLSKTFISPADFIHSDLREVGCPRDEDDEYYKSIIATPIRVDDKVYGVFVITSSTDAQFNEKEHKQPTEILGMSIAQGIKLCRSDKSLFVEQPTAQRKRTKMKKGQ